MICFDKKAKQNCLLEYPQKTRSLSWCCCCWRKWLGCNRKRKCTAVCTKGGSFSRNLGDVWSFSRGLRAWSQEYTVHFGQRFDVETEQHGRIGGLNNYWSEHGVLWTNIVELLGLNLLKNKSSGIFILFLAGQKVCVCARTQGSNCGFSSQNVWLKSETWNRKTT